MTMAIVHFVQFALAMFSALSQNSPVNESTMVMAVLYIFIILLEKDFLITKELIKDVLIKDIYEKKIAKQFPEAIGYLICVLASPIVLILIAGSIVLEFFIGKVMEVSFGSIVDLVINVFVTCTSISVGLRSGNGISAIQTFVGFDFISGFDELIIDRIDPNFYGPGPNYIDDTDPEQKKLRDARRGMKNTYRIILYIAVPLIFGFYCYLTIANPCFVFCSN